MYFDWNFKQYKKIFKNAIAEVWTWFFLYQLLKSSRIKNETFCDILIRTKAIQYPF